MEGGSGGEKKRLREGVMEREGEIEERETERGKGTRE